ncbi:hypothetical protein M079_1790 [Bacteroides fragilis str. 3996 N(B) 6]|jgi:hypothetical protein|uniref:Transmembrane protein n=2 Tax=Bacteroides fragilis TaxID=817 RepID=A0A015U875_BACFG|nr:hypothetical protein M079_1790 [Bacteroides fragilis str. 3996 N(B) 6]EXY91077.1 hypothetical protein M125_2216 [Bacteroides fragilis str. 3998T(B)3]EXY95925.1 hypothetical protein M081_1924 [Bacteroides fragilis str. 3998 T(B) 4]
MFLFCADLFNVVSVLCAFCCLYCNMYFVFVSFCILLMLIYGLFSSFPVSRAGKTNSIAGKIYNLTIVRFLLRPFIESISQSLLIKDAAGMYSYIPKQAQVRIRFMSFYNVYTFLICHMGREMSFFMFPGLFRDPVMRYSVVSMPSRGSRIRCFLPLAGEKEREVIVQESSIPSVKKRYCTFAAPRKGEVLQKCNADF